MLWWAIKYIFSMWNKSQLWIKATHVDVHDSFIVEEIDEDELAKILEIGQI